jgi:phage terminase small subunit
MKSESDSARVAAANAILDRGYGKPTQAHQHSGAIGSYDLTRISDGDLQKLESILGPLADAGGNQSGEA